MCRLADWVYSYNHTAWLGHVYNWSKIQAQINRFKTKTGWDTNISDKCTSFGLVKTFPTNIVIWLWYFLPISTLLIDHLWNEPHFGFSISCNYHFQIWCSLKIFLDIKIWYLLQISELGICLFWKSYCHLVLDCNKYQALL